MYVSGEMWCMGMWGVEVCGVLAIIFFLSYYFPRVQFNTLLFFLFLSLSLPQSLYLSLYWFLYIFIFAFSRLMSIWLSHFLFHNFHSRFSQFFHHQLLSFFVYFSYCPTFNEFLSISSFLCFSLTFWGLYSGAGGVKHPLCKWEEFFTSSISRVTSEIYLIIYLLFNYNNEWLFLLLLWEFFTLALADGPPLKWQQVSSSLQNSSQYSSRSW